MTLARRIDGSKTPLALGDGGRGGQRGAGGRPEGAVRRGAGAPRGRDRRRSGTLDEAIEAAQTGWARVPWDAVGVEGEAKANESAITVRCLIRPTDRCRRRSRRAGPDRDPGPLVLTAWPLGTQGGSSCTATSSGARLGLLKTAFVLADDERGLWLWVPLGAPMLDRRAVDGRGLRAMPFSQWLRIDTKLWEVTWRGPGVLMFLPPGAESLGLAVPGRRRAVHRLLREPRRGRCALGRR